MALTESKVLAHVGINLAANSADVRWDNLIERDGEVISRVPHRKAYSVEQKSDFLAEVEGAENYLGALGWAA